MTALSAQEPSEWDEDPAWSRPDPMTAAELEADLDRVCEQDEGHLQDEADLYGDVEPLTAEELAEIREAAADELLAVEAATTGRRGPGQPGSARVFPGQSASPAAGFGPGMPLDVLPGCPQLAVAADAAGGEDGRFAGVSEAELVGVVCAWDRVEAHAGARKLAAIADQIFWIIIGQTKVPAKLFTGNAIWMTSSAATGGPGAAPHGILVRCLQA